MNDIIKTLIASDPKVRFIIKKLPVFGKVSEYAARAALAASKQSNTKFIAFHSALLEEKSKLSEKTVMDIAKKVGLDTKALKSDMETKAVKDAIHNNFKLAQDIGLLGTPAFIVGNAAGTKVNYIAGSTDLKELKEIIAKIRS